MDAILSEAERAVARTRNLARIIRARAIEDARGLPNGFNLTQTLEAWHEERVAHLLTAGVFSDAWLEALLHYASAIESAASLFLEWNAAAVRIAALSDTHTELQEDLQYLIGTVLTAERERRQIR